MGMFGMGRAFSSRFQVGAPVCRPGRMMTPMPPMARMPMARGPIFMMGMPGPAPHHCHAKGMLISGGIGFGLGALFGWLTRKNQPPQAYGPQAYGPQPYGPQPYGPQGNPQELQNLQTLYGSKYQIVQNPNGTYTVAKDGQTVLDDATYDQVIDAMKNGQGTSTPSSVPGAGTGTPTTTGAGNTEVEDDAGGKGTGVEDPSKNGSGNKDVKAAGSGSETGGASGVETPGQDDGGNTTVKGSEGNSGAAGVNGSEKGSGTEEAGNGKQDGHVVEAGDNLWNIAKAHLKEKNGVNPTNAEILAETKRLMEVNGLNFADNNGKVLIRPGDFIKYGDSTPEVKSKGNEPAERSKQPQKGNMKDSIYTAKNSDFITKDKDGNLHYYDKDGNEMSETEFRGKHNTINITNIKNGGYSSQKDTRVQGDSGCWAEKNGDGWNYFRPDGSSMTAEEVQKEDPKLWNQAGWYAPLKLAEEPKKQDVDFTKPNNWDNVRLGKQWGQE